MRNTEIRIPSPAQILQYKKLVLPTNRAKADENNTKYVESNHRK